MEKGYEIIKNDKKYLFQNKIDNIKKIIYILKNKNKNKKEKKLKFIKTINSNNYLTKNFLNYIYKKSFMILFIIYIINFPICLSKQIKIIHLSSDSEIKLTIKGNGSQPILNINTIELVDNYYISFNDLPTEIIVNGKTQTTIGKYVYNLNEGNNYIILKWNYSITNCDFMFYNLNYITEVDLSNFDSSKVTSMKKMFFFCHSLESINLTNLNTDIVKDTISMFDGCTSLKSIIDLINFNFSSVNNMNLMFYDCKALTSINININSSSLLNAIKLFYGCINLKKININLYAPNVIDLNDMFFKCNQLTSIDLSNSYLPSVLYMANIFQECISLKSVNLSNIINNNCEYIDNMFNGCFLLESIDFTNFYTKKIKGMGNLFLNCKSLKLLNLSSFDTSSVTNMGHMFAECISLTSIIINNLNAKSSLVTDYMFYNCNLLKSIDLSNFDASSVSNMEYMFYKCKNLISLDFSNFKTISADNMDFMFYGCSGLTTLDLSGFNTLLVKKMTKMFFGCSSLKSLDLSNFKTSFISNMGEMFKGCRKLSSLNLSSFDTSNVIDMNNMFNGCYDLTSLNLSSFYTSSVNNLNSMFIGCRSLKYLNLKNFDTSLVVNMNNMFNGCTSLKELDLSNFNISSVKYMAAMFNNCYSLTSLELFNFYKSSILDINSIFYNCSSLISLNLNNFNTFFINNYTQMIYKINSSLEYCINNEITSSDIISELSSYTEKNCSDLCYIYSNKFIANKNKCINDCKNDDIYKYEYNNFCYSLCPNGTNNSENSFLCEKICEKYYNYNHTNCIEEIPLGYYLNNSQLKTIDKCDIKCNNCTYESMSNGLCISCNNNESYFPKLNDIENEKRFINCYNQTPEGYYFDNNNKVYIPNQNNFNFSDISTNSEININKNTELSLNNDTEIFSNKDLDITTNIITNMSINKNTEEITNRNTIFIEYNTNKKTDNLLIYETSINTNNYSEINSHSFSHLNFLDDDIFFYERNKNQSKYSYEINSNINELKNKYNNITFIELSQESKDLIIEKFNLDKEKDKIYFIINDNLINDSRMATSDYEYKLILENGTELNISLINEDFYATISVPLKNLILAKFNIYEYFIEQEYDIYDKNSNFYNDICSPAHLEDNDITLEDRNKEIFPNNVTLCKSNCEYKETNIKDKKIICECNLNVNKNYSSSIMDEDFFSEEDENFFDYILDNINYKIFKCYKLFLDFEKIKKSIPFYAMLVTLFIILIITLKFYTCDLSKLKALLVKDSILSPKAKIFSIKQITKFKKTKKRILLSPVKKKGKKDKNTKKINIKIKKKKPKENKKEKIKLDISTSKAFIKKSKKEKKKINLNKTSISKKKTIIINFKNKNNNNLNNKENDKENINELPFTLAIYKDKRNLIEIFESIIIEKLGFINLFFGQEKIKVILLSQYILSLLVDFFFNSLLYSDEIVSHKYHNNGKLEFVVTLLLSILSNIISSIVCYYLDYSKLVEERLEQIIEMKKAYYYKRILDKFIRNLKLKMIYLFIKEILIIIFCFYYIIIFCVIYSYSTTSLLYNYLSSLIENIITSILISFIIVFTRKVSLIFSNRYIYNTSKYINEKF